MAAKMRARWRKCARDVVRVGLVVAGVEAGAWAEGQTALPVLDQSPERSLWSVGATVTPQWFFGSRADWADVNLSVKRQWPGLSIAVGYVRTTRYGLWDDGGWTDTYLTVWPGAYGNVSLQIAPESRVIPRWDGAVELFQAVGGGWEAACRVRRMTFPSSAVWLTTPAVAWYTGEWYLRARVTQVSPAGTSLSWSAQARRYLGHAERYVEVTVGLGVSDSATTTAVGSSSLAWSDTLGAKFQTPIGEWGDVGCSIAHQNDAVLGRSWTLGLDFKVRP